MQEQVNEKTVAITIKAAKLTGRLLAKAMQAFLKKAREPTFKTGKQSVKSLTKQGASLTNVEITGDNIGSFNRIARKYNVDFALKKDGSETPPKWIVFFKGRDKESIDAAFKAYFKKEISLKDRKPSLLARLAKAKELVSQTAPPVKNRNKGGHEL